MSTNLDDPYIWSRAPTGQWNLSAKHNRRVLKRIRLGDHGQLGGLAGVQWPSMGPASLAGPANSMIYWHQGGRAEEKLWGIKVAPSVIDRQSASKAANGAQWGKVNHGSCCIHRNRVGAWIRVVLSVSPSAPSHQGALFPFPDMWARVWAKACQARSQLHYSHLRVAYRPSPSKTQVSIRVLHVAHKSGGTGTHG